METKNTQYLKNLTSGVNMIRKLSAIIIILLLLTGCLEDTALLTIEPLVPPNADGEPFVYHKNQDENANTTKLEFDGISEYEDNLLYILSKSTWISSDKKSWTLSFSKDEIKISSTDFEDYLIYRFELIETNIDDGSILLKIIKTDWTNMYKGVFGLGEIEVTDNKVKIVLLNDSLKFIVIYGIEEEFTSEWKRTQLGE